MTPMPSMRRRWRQAFGAAALSATAAVTHAAGADLAAVQVTAPNGQASLLLGSVHVGYPGLRQPAPSVIQKARVLVIEHTLEGEPIDTALAPESFASLVATGDVTRAHWAAELTEAQLERMRTNLNCIAPKSISRSDFEMLLAMRSPRLFAGYAYLPCSRLPGGDVAAISAAKATSIPVVTLETLAEIGQRRAAIPDRIYRQQLYRGVQTDLAALYDALAAVVNRGDYDAIGPMVQGTYDAPEDGALVQRILLTERNAAWLARLRTELDQGNAAVVVGAAHLGGADGLIALLNQAGYRTRTVAVPAAD